MSNEDHEDIEPWLRSRPFRSKTCFAARCALRTVPAAALLHPQIFDAHVLSLLRLSLATCIALTENDELFYEAARSARNAVKPEIQRITSSGSAKVIAVSAMNSAICNAADQIRISSHEPALEAWENSLGASAGLSSIPSVFDGGERANDRSAARNRTKESAAFDVDFMHVDSFPRVFEQPLWSQAKPPPAIATHFDLLQDKWQQNLVIWNFWIRWYRGMFVGDPLPWALQQAVALIPDVVWSAGAEAVAKRIADIEEELGEGSGLDQELAISQAQILLKTSLRSELEARGLSDLIKMAVHAYEREISNCLPDELEPLRDLPGVLDKIALELASDEPATAKERELAELVQQMSRTINELNRRLERLHAEKKAGSPQRLFADAFYTNAGAGFGKLVSSRLFWGGVIGSGLVLMGVGSEAATDRLAWMCNELILQEGAEVLQMPPSDGHGGPKFERPPEK